MTHDEPYRGDPESTLEEAERLIWSLLDEQIDDADAVRLNRMLKTDAGVRRRYLECVQLQVDLRDRFERQAAAPSRGGVMPDLFPNLPGLSSPLGITPPVE